MNSIKNTLLKLRFKMFGRPAISTGETENAKARRNKENFFEKYCQGKGLDIGYGGNLVSKNCDGYDFEHGDAQYLKNINDESYDFVYNSHLIEHMVNPSIALKNWWRVLKTGGHLIIYGPLRDLYEKKTTLPSRWNSDHKHFFHIDKDEAPDTIGIIPLINRSLTNFDLIYIKECSEGHTITDPLLHSDGEYSFELVLQKK